MRATLQDSILVFAKWHTENLCGLPCSELCKVGSVSWSWNRHRNSSAKGKLYNRSGGNSVHQCSSMKITHLQISNSYYQIPTKMQTTTTRDTKLWAPHSLRSRSWKTNKVFVYDNFFISVKTWYLIILVVEKYL